MTLAVLQLAQRLLRVERGGTCDGVIAAGDKTQNQRLKRGGGDTWQMPT